jgi:Fur family zinc uptake transcriptional regulator
MTDRPDTDAGTPDPGTQGTDGAPPDGAEAALTALAPHDHRACRAAALAEARAVCAERGLRLTPMRERVLEILLEEHTALGAYDVLRRLTDEGAGPQPPVAYRALDFLVSNGFAHRIERLNAYVACTCPGEGHVPAFLICRGCGVVAETRAPALSDEIVAQAEALGFRIETPVVEVAGTCADCAAGANA